MIDKKKILLQLLLNLYREELNELQAFNTKLRVTSPVPDVFRILRRNIEPHFELWTQYYGEWTTLDAALEDISGTDDDYDDNVQESLRESWEQENWQIQVGDWVLVDTDDPRILHVDRSESDMQREINAICEDPEKLIRRADSVSLSGKDGTCLLFRVWSWDQVAVEAGTIFDPQDAMAFLLPP